MTISELRTLSRGNGYESKRPISRFHNCTRWNDVIELFADRPHPDASPYVKTSYSKTLHHRSNIEDGAAPYRIKIDFQNGSVEKVGVRVTP